MRKNLQTLALTVARYANDVSNDGKERAKDCINDALVTIKRERPWSFLRDIAGEITLSAGVDIYNTPPGLLNIQRVYYRNTDGTQRFLDKVTDEVFQRDWDGHRADDPAVYRIVSMDSTEFQSRLQIAPAPSAVFLAGYGTTLYLEQTSDIARLTNDSDLPDLPGDFTQAIEYLAAANFCLQQSDQAQAQGYLQGYALAITTLKADDANRYGKMFPIKPSLSSAPNSWRRRRRLDYTRIPR